MKQFDLEQQIMSCWNIVDDLDVLLEEVCEGEPMTTDRMANIVLGMKEMYDIKFNKLFRTFEDFLKEYYNLRNTKPSMEDSSYTEDC
jgi:hypothetical protein